MKTKSFDLIWAALQQFFKAATPEEAANILRQHPELLSAETDSVFDLLIEQAREADSKEALEFLIHQYKTLQIFRQMLQKAYQKSTSTNDEDGNL
jgi:hypothetical protein